MKKFSIGGVLLAAVLGMGASETAGCDNQPSSDQIQRQQQEKILAEGTAQIGMPAIVNFRERKLLKDIFELRDQDGLVTYTYTFAENSGTITKLCDSIGYGIPYATQYTSPEKPLYQNTSVGYAIPQADPNGLFSPGSADGTWVMCSDPSTSGKVRPVFIEPRVIVSPFPLK